MIQHNAGCVGLLSESNEGIGLRYNNGGDFPMADEKKKIGNSIHPFGNVLALKNVKDKKTGKGGFKNLFDSVDAIGSAVESLQAFGSLGPEEAGIAEEFLSTLTKMQVHLLDMCKEKIVGSNVLLPPEQEDPEMGGMGEAGEMGGEVDGEPMLGQKLISKHR